MEYNEEYTKLYWSLIVGVLLAQPTCNKKNCNKKCKYRALCRFTILISGREVP